METRQRLNRERITEAALSLIDAGGFAEFSMRKLGTALGVDAMAVYRHFKDREDLFDGVAEAIFDQVDTDSLPWEGSWRELMEQYCLRLRSALLRHPHAVPVFATRPVRSAASIRTGNRMIEQLRDSGFPVGDALRIARCLREFTVGHALNLSVVELGSGKRSGKPSSNSPQYNLLAQAADESAIDDHFNLGLTAMLDGFERTTPSPDQAVGRTGKNTRTGVEQKNGNATGPDR